MRLRNIKKTLKSVRSYDQFIFISNLCEIKTNLIDKQVTNLFHQDNEFGRTAVVFRISPYHRNDMKQGSK